MGSELEEVSKKKKKTMQRDCAEQENKQNKRMNCQRKWNFHPWSYPGREEGAFYYRLFRGMNWVPPQRMGTDQMTRRCSFQSKQLRNY